MEFNKENIDLARANKEVVVFKGLFNNTPDWQQFIDHIQYATFQPDEGIREDHRTYGYAHWWYQLTATIDHSHRSIQQAQDNMIKIQEVNPNIGTSFSIVSFTTREPSTNLHNDPTDVFYWQCIGKVDWMIGRDRSNRTAYTLESGDLIYVPEGTWHEILAKTPRAAISYCCTNY
jgi:ribosomal protein L16 Arg81 hydroxylase